MNPASKKLGELLVDRRLISKDVLATLLDKETQTGTPLAKLLTDDGHVREEDLLRTVAGRVGMEYIDLEDELLDPEAVGRLDAEDARSLLAIPVKIAEDGSLVVAVADPFDSERHRRLEQVTGGKVTLALSTKAAIKQTLEVCASVRRYSGHSGSGDGGADRRFGRAGR